MTSGSVEVCNAVVASAYESGAVRLDVWVRVCESANACVCAYACAHASVCVRLPFFFVAQKWFSLQTVKLTDPYWKGMNDGGLLYPCVRARCGASGCDCAHTRDAAQVPRRVLQGRDAHWLLLLCRQCVLRGGAALCPRDCCCPAELTPARAQAAPRRSLIGGRAFLPGTRTCAPAFLKRRHGLLCDVLLPAQVRCAAVEDGPIQGR